VWDDEEAIMKRSDKKVDREEIKFNKEEKSSADRAVIKKADALCKRQKYYNLTKVQTSALKHYGAVLGYDPKKEECKELLRFYKETDFFHDGVHDTRRLSAPHR
jgi:hypothetical protein